MSRCAKEKNISNFHSPTHPPAQKRHLWHEIALIWHVGSMTAPWLRGYDWKGYESENKKHPKNNNHPTRHPPERHQLMFVGSFGLRQRSSIPSMEWVILLRN
jgi:hypothetical protein